MLRFFAHSGSSYSSLAAFAKMVGGMSSGWGAGFSMIEEIVKELLRKSFQSLIRGEMPSHNIPSFSSDEVKGSGSV